MLAVLILALLMCVAAISIIACASQGKANFNRKTTELRRVGDHRVSISKAKQHSIRRRQEDSTEQHHHDHPHPRHHVLRRTNSTTGFPTLEKRRRRRRKSQLGEGARSRTVPSSDLTRGIMHRSLSLPSLPVSAQDKSATPHFNFLQEQEPSITRRINRVCIRVKRLNMEHIGLDSWAIEQLKGNKTFRNLRIVQDLAIRQKNYGVEEIQQRSTENRCGPYASYTTRTLAASARSPEPGAKPATLL